MTLEVGEGRDEWDSDEDERIAVVSNVLSEVEFDLRHARTASLVVFFVSGSEHETVGCY